MPFNTLLTKCLIPGTGCHEKKASVNIGERESGEVILFFKIDEGHDSQFRQDMRYKGSMCDLIIFYAKGSQRVLCLTELKGSDLDKAVEQVTATKKVLIEAFKEDHLSRGIQRNLTFKAYIRFHGSSIKKSDKAKADAGLQAEFSCGNWDITHKTDIGPFLRMAEEKEPTHKKRKKDF